MGHSRKAPVKKRILVTVKTYPSLSMKYDELVCTAGVQEDGSWIRLYPIPFRRLDYGRKFKKYDWIEVEAQSRKEDERPESFMPDFSTIEVRGFVNTKDNWRRRKDFVLKNVYEDMAELITLAHGNKLSLAVFKPERVTDFRHEPVSAEEHEKNKAKVKKILDKRKQLSLIDDGLRDTSLASKPGYRFYYTFEDINRKESRMMIEDWEIQALYRNCLSRKKDRKQALADVRKKYWDDFVHTTDLHLFLGTTLEYHRKKASNPFTIIGTFTPKKQHG